MVFDVLVCGEGFDEGCGECIRRFWLGVSWEGLSFASDNCMSVFYVVWYLDIILFVAEVQVCKCKFSRFQFFGL